jgi:hypothetical protein
MGNQIRDYQCLTTAYPKQYKQAEGFVWMGSRMRSVWVRRRDEDTPARKTDGRERR